MTPNRNGFDVGASQQLFPIPITIVSQSNYDVAADGQSMLLRAYTLDSAAVSPLAMVVNWTAVLRPSR